MNFYKTVMLSGLIFWLPAYGMEVVQKILLPDSLLDKSGNLKNGEAAAFFLSEAFAEGKLNNPSFKSASCLKIDVLSISGWGTKQLFSVRSSCSAHEENFILKEMAKPDEEIRPLMQATAYPPLRLVIYPNETKSFPTLVFPIAYLAYNDKAGKLRQFTLMNTAKGRPLLYFIKQFIKNPHDKDIIRTISEAYFDIGAAIARFYKMYGQPGILKGSLPLSIAHGDLHSGNIFYHNRHITLIDNDRISRSIEKRTDVCGDMAFLLIKSIFVLKWTNELTDHFPYQEFYELSLPSFIAGFLSTYPQREQKNIFMAIKQCIENFRDHNDPQLNVFYKNKDVLGVSISEYMQPILARLEDWFGKGHFVSEDFDVNTRDSNGKTLLFNAVERERLLMWPLIAAGADVGARDGNNNTPLHDAAWLDKTHAIRILIDAGADISAKDKNGDTPLDKARISNSKAAFESLVSGGASVSNLDACPLCLRYAGQMDASERTQTPCCKKLICRDDLARVKAAGQPCPLCRSRERW